VRRARVPSAIIEDIERRSDEQNRDLAELRALVEALVAKNEETAARLGEAEHELAATRTALEIETGKRKQVEEQNGKMAAAMSAAREALHIGQSSLEPVSCSRSDAEVAAETWDVATLGSVDDAALSLLSEGDRDAFAEIAAARRR
jgi:chromosome segregation ATPase